MNDIMMIRSIFTQLLVDVHFSLMTFCRCLIGQAEIMAATLGVPKQKCQELFQQAIKYQVSQLINFSLSLSLSD